MNAVSSAVRQSIVPGTEQHFTGPATGAGAGATPAAPAKPRKPRKPSKRVQELIDAAARNAWHQGYNAPRDRWPGAMAAVGLAAVAFAAGYWFG